MPKTPKSFFTDVSQPLKSHIDGASSIMDLAEHIESCAPCLAGIHCNYGHAMALNMPRWAVESALDRVRRPATRPSPIQADQFLLHALEYSNAADDVVMLMVSSGVAQQMDKQSARDQVDRCRPRVVPSVVAAFICWASGGAYAIRRDS